MTKKIVALILALVMCVALIGCGAAPAAAPAEAAPAEDAAAEAAPAAPEEVINLKLSTAWGENSACQEGALKFGELLTAATNGKYTVTVYPSDQLASGNQITAIEMVQTGATDLDLRGICLYSTIDERFTVLNMPFIMPTYEDVDNIFFNGPGAEALNAVVEDNGLVPLGWCEAGYRQITNNVREITSPADMKGIKFRVPSMPMFLELYNTLGTNATSISMGEVFTSLQQGVIEGQENAVDTAQSYNIQEVQKYLTCWNGIYDAILFSASPELWASLSEEEQAIFQQCSDEAMAYQIERSRVEEEEIWANFEAAGCHVTHLTDEQIAEFKDATASVYDTYYDKIGADLFTAFGYTK